MSSCDHDRFGLLTRSRGWRISDERTNVPLMLVSSISVISQLISESLFTHCFHGSGICAIHVDKTLSVGSSISCLSCSVPSKTFAESTADSFSNLTDQLS